MTDQEPVQKFSKQKQRKNEYHRSEFKGANKDLGVFSYQNDRMSAEAFNTSKQTLIDYLNVKHAHAGYALEHGVHFPFEISDIITDPNLRAKAEDHLGKSAADYIVRELPEAYGVLYGQCDPSLRSALEETENFNIEIHAKRNFLGLWKAISTKCLNPIRSDLTNHINIMNRQQAAKSKFEEFFQHKRENVAEFYRRFETEVTAAESCGVNFINEIVFNEEMEIVLNDLKSKALKPFQEAKTERSQAAKDALKAVKVSEGKKDEIKKAIRDKALAYEFVKKLNRTVYQDMQVELANKLNDGNDDYPLTVLEARRRAEGRVRSFSKNNIPIQNNVAFAAAGTGGANKRNNNNPKKSKANGNDGGKPAKTNKGCYYCQATGHFQNDCPLYKEAVDILKAKSAANASSVKVQAVTVLDSIDTEEIGFCTVGQLHDETVNVSMADKTEATAMVSRRPSIIEDSDILLDNQATVSVFHYKPYLRNLRLSSNPVTIVGVGGKLTATHVGDFGTFGEVYYHPDAVANILCFCDVSKHYKTIYDPIDDKFVITNKVNNKKIEFTCRNKLYSWNPRNALEQSILVQTVEENMSRYTRREIQDAQEARSAFIKLGRPAIKDFKEMIGNGKIMNCPFTVKDVDRATEIFGKDLGMLKGRTTRKPPEPIKTEYVEREAQELTISGDIFYIFGIPFLATISRKMKLIVVQHLEDGKKTDSILKGFKSIMQLYNRHNCKVSHFLSDTEAGLQGIQGHLNELGIAYVPASKNQHVGEIERSIRQIKERCRTFVNTLPFLFPTMITVHLVYFCVKMINAFPHEGQNTSPRELLTGMKIDYKADCKLEFGTYCQVNEDNTITNTMASRTVGAICLGSNASGGNYKFLSLATWKVIVRGSWTELPIPREVIEAINKKAIEDDTKGHLKSHQIAKGLSKTEKKAKKKKQKIITNSDSSDDSDFSVHSDNDQTPQKFEDYITSSDDEEGTTHHRDSNSEDNNNLMSSDDDESDRDFERAKDAIANVASNEECDDGINTLKKDCSIDETEWSSKLSEIFKSFGHVFNLSLLELQEGLKSIGSATYNTFRRKQESEEKNKRMLDAVLTQMSVKSGIKKWGAKAIVAAMEELQQLISKDVFIFVERKSLTYKQQKSILRTLLFLKEKRDGRLKGRCCVDGRPQAFIIQATDPFSPTVATETLFVSATIDSYENREVATADIEGAYLIVNMFDEEVYCDLDPVLSAIVVAMYPVLAKFLDEFGRLTARLGRALYGCIQSARMFFEHLKKTLTDDGFKSNPYEPCIFNKLSETGHQVTVTVYVDDVKVSSVESEAVDRVLSHLRSVYTTISVKRGKQLEYLGINLDYGVKGEVTIDMIGMIKDITKDLPEDVKKVATPADVNLFKMKADAIFCDDGQSKSFHSIVAKLLYVAKRARPDILTAVSYLTTRVKEPTLDDVKKLNRVLTYLKSTCNLKLTLRCDNIEQLICYVDAAHFVHVDGKGHSGVVITLGGGSLYNSSRKQKLVSKSSTESELIAISDGLSQAIWLRNLLIEQGYKMKPLILYEDNQSTITLIKKGKSTSERTRHVDLRYFFIADRVKTKEVIVIYMPTKSMLADMHTKALQGALFKEMRDKTMNIFKDQREQLPGCVGKSEEDEV